MNLHEYLKRAAVLWLLNRRCYIAGTEIYIPRSARLNAGMEQDRELIETVKLKKYKQFIDACGIGIQYRSQWRLEFTQDNAEDYKSVVIRGIEVKTSRSDYRNGFVASGCNYNYLLTPKGLLKKTEIPQKMGLIEYDKDKFSCSKAWNNPFQFKGLRVVKKPSKQIVPEKDFKMITSEVGRKMRPILIETLFDKFNTLKVG